ncbi:hypothetical protein [Streptomyces sp. NRRL B-3648]|uniref:hypothetical protein n=1 Tax=Streptomyces sp. NRRL B-3648 TaxID=1519493 RepID=UPI0006AF059B|nr:hypothetical protein [Streptomyces sp. NRRL B-3648]
MEQLSAGKKLDRAFEKLGEKKTLSFQLDLDTDVASLKALDAGSDPAPGEEIPDEVARMLSGATVTFTVQSRKPMDESGQQDLVGMAMKISSKDGDLAEYRVIGDSVYVRSDVRALGRMTGTPVPSADDLPPQAGALKDAFEGKWVTFSVKEMEKSAGGGRGARGGSARDRSLDAGTQKKLVQSLREVVAREVRLRTAGGGDGTEHITATAPFRTLITQLLHEIRPLAKDLPQGMELPTDKDLKDAPDTKVTADFTLKNGELSEVDVDLAALARNAKVRKLGLTLKVSDGTRPTAPAGATKLDLKDVMGGLFAGPAMSDAELGGSDLGGQDFPQDEF